MSRAASLLEGEGLRLPISRRGLFFKDDFFSGFQDNYKTAVEDVLDKWRSRSSPADRFAFYRKLRDREPSDHNQAATISETPDNYVIVLDMGKYSGGHITVETQGYNAVVKGECGDLSYHRRFPLPRNTNTDRVVADLSDEGILTVSAPRRDKGDQAKGSVSYPVKETRVINTSSERVIPTSRDDVRIHSATQRTTQHHAATSGRKGSSSRIIPLTIEGDAEGTDTTSTATSETGDAYERVIPTVREGNGTSSSQSKAESRVLPIHRRGRFYQDSAFENVWDAFENAVDDLVVKRDDEGTKNKTEEDQIQSYRDLRKVVKKEDNQAATLSKEEDEYKIVMDVKDFADGLLDVKALAGSVMVTGQKGSNNFEKRFSIPELLDPEKVSAALSADGVLTITAPM